MIPCIERRRLIVTLPALTIACALGSATPAAAQATTVVRPSIGVGAVYDDNVLWSPENTVDHIWRLTPGLTFTRETRRTNWTGEFEVDSEWFNTDTKLSTPLARQHAFTRAEWRTGQTYAYSLGAGYDNTMTAQELNIATGLIPGRARAWRWNVSPGVSARVSPRTRLEARYDLMSDHSDVAPDITTHRTEFRAEHGVAERTTLQARYRGEFFRFEQGDWLLTHTPLFGVTRALTSSTQAVLEGGVRFGGDRLHPEIDARLQRRTTFTESSVGYTFTQATALGVGSLVDLQSVSGSVRYLWPESLESVLRGGAYFNGIGGDRIDIYRASADVSKRLFGIVWLTAEYSFDYQRGRLILPIDNGGVIVAPGDNVVVPPLTPGPRPGDRVRRSVIMLRITLAGVLRNAAGPREPPATTPGAPQGAPSMPALPGAPPQTGRPQ
jgi:hypothetical protein